MGRNSSYQSLSRPGSPESDELPHIHIWLYDALARALNMRPETIRLVRRDTPLDVPKAIQTDAGTVTVFDPMFPLHWDVET